jgi:hypothetical protein
LLSKLGQAGRSRDRPLHVESAAVPAFTDIDGGTSRRISIFSI